MKLKLKLVYTLLCCVLVSALHLPQHASGDHISGWFPFPGRKLLKESDFEKKNETNTIHGSAKKSRVVEVNSKDTEHRYEDEGGLIFYNSDYNLAATHASPLPKHHP